MNSKNENAYSWFIDIKLKSPKNAFKEIFSPSHLIELRMKGFEAEVKFLDGRLEKPNKDFVLQYCVEKLTNILLAKNLTDQETAPYCAMITFIPKEQKQ